MRGIFLVQSLDYWVPISRFLRGREKFSLRVLSDHTAVTTAACSSAIRAALGAGPGEEEKREVGIPYILWFKALAFSLA